ncbi:MAG TPA: hypothetical protein VMA77_10400 [Solirubrobacteraceae bacterium]|nr:hypothetical protein [Solirubrobacteraceae bacterium]
METHAIRGLRGERTLFAVDGVEVPVGERAVVDASGEGRVGSDLEVRAIPLV